MKSLIEVKRLIVEYRSGQKTVKAVNGISFDLSFGETLGLVGETGAGKTTTALSIMGLVPKPAGRIVSGEILFEGEELPYRNNQAMRQIRGNKISMIFQDPMTSLNPVFCVGEQIAEGLRLHAGLNAKQAVVEASEMMERVGIPAVRYREYPHQFSGGMKQRIGIAMALACNPALLIADEPTTALDVTIQAQILDMINEINESYSTSMIIITHDLGVVAEICDRVAIVYAGQIVEVGDKRHVYKNAKHPYTTGLFMSMPSIKARTSRLTPIMGSMPDPTNLPQGCAFAPRCPHVMPVCQVSPPEPYEVELGHQVRCHLYSRRLCET